MSNDINNYMNQYDFEDDSTWNEKAQDTLKGYADGKTIEEINDTQLELLHQACEVMKDKDIPADVKDELIYNNILKEFNELQAKRDEMEVE